MGKLFNILAFLLVVLFIAGLCWLGVESYKFMKNQPSEDASALADIEIGNTVKDKAVFDSEEPDEWDEMDEEDDEMDDVEEEGEDLLEDENIREHLTEKEEQIKTPAKRDTPAEFNKAVNLSPSGTFLVIAGSFTIAENADKEVATLKKKGYANAETVQFASTKYLSVCTGRFKTEKEAKEMAAKLKKDLKIDAYVHKRRMK